MGRSRTYTRAFKSPNIDGGEWFWETLSDTVAIDKGQKGFRTLDDAQNGFLAAQGVSEEDKVIARDFSSRIKRSPSEYEFVFDRASFEQSKGK